MTIHGQILWVMRLPKRVVVPDWVPLKRHECDRRAVAPPSGSCNFRCLAITDNLSSTQPVMSLSRLLRETYGMHYLSNTRSFPWIGFEPGLSLSDLTVSRILECNQKGSKAVGEASGYPWEFLGGQDRKL